MEYPECDDVIKCYLYYLNSDRIQTGHLGF